MSVPVPQLQPRKPLTILEIAGSTIAQIAPAFSFYFSFAVISAAAGIGAPLTILLAAVAILIVGISLINFAREIPTSGSLVTYLGMTFGGIVGTSASVIFAFAYVLLLASVMLVIGGWTSLSLQTFFGLNISWIPLTIIFSVIAWLLTVIGIDRSTRVATAAMFIEVAILLLVSILVLFNPPVPLSLAPFSPSSISGGLSGLGLGFPLAVFLFIGFENSIALAEETQEPRRSIPRAVLTSIALMGLLYLFVAYATISGFRSAAQLGQSQIPFMDLAQHYLGGFAVLAALAGFTSAGGTLLAGSNNLSRVLFNSGREGLFPAFLGRVNARFGTPAVALTIPAILALLLALAVGISSGGWENGFAICSTLGTIPLIVVYGAVNVAVIFSRRLASLSVVQRVIVPILGVISLAIPLWTLIQPGQPAPSSYFPWITLAVLVIAVAYATWRVRSDPKLPGRIGALAVGNEYVGVSKAGEELGGSKLDASAVIEDAAVPADEAAPATPVVAREEPALIKEETPALPVNTSEEPTLLKEETPATPTATNGESALPNEEIPTAPAEPGAKPLRTEEATSSTISHEESDRQ